MRHALLRGGSTAPVPVAMLAAMLALSVGCGGSGGGDDAPFVALTTFQPATFVIGQEDFTSGLPNQGGPAAADTLRAPYNRVGGDLYVADRENNRVLGFLGGPSADGDAADFVMGQPDFASTAGGTGPASFAFPVEAVVAGGRLFVVDGNNHRVLIWNSLPTSNVPADVVVGQVDFTSNAPGLTASTFDNPRGLAVSGTRMFVADKQNHRVLVWNTVPTTNGAAADLVLGQADFTSAVPAVGPSSMSSPRSVHVDGSAVVVADEGNNRVLVWSSVSATAQGADLVLCQTDLISNGAGFGASEMDSPRAVHGNGTQLFVGDTANNRVLVWDSFPTVSGQPADRVLGQSDFSHNTANDEDQDSVSDGVPSARTFAFPQGVFASGNRLYVSDRSNSRILVFVGS